MKPLTAPQCELLLICLDKEIGRIEYSRETQLKVFKDMGMDTSQLDDVQFRERIKELKQLYRRFRRLMTSLEANAIPS